MRTILQRLGWILVIGAVTGTILLWWTFDAKHSDQLEVTTDSSVPMDQKPHELPIEKRHGATQSNRIKAVVNGEIITEAALNDAVRTRIRLYLMENQGMVTAAQAESDIQNIEKNALAKLIDRKLILTEFNTMGGAVADKYVDQVVDQFVHSKFKGDRDKFLKQLSQQGISLTQFRDMQEEQIVIDALRDKQHQSNLDIWLEKLRRDSNVRIYD